MNSRHLEVKKAELTALGAWLKAAQGGVEDDSRLVAVGTIETRNPGKGARLRKDMHVHMVLSGVRVSQIVLARERS